MKQLAICSAFAACALFAAELKVTDADMPRVPPTEPDKAASTLQVREGFRAEIVAHEPLVNSPVAIAFDESGRMFVVEMRDYSERRDERLGRIQLLTDENGDGRFDRATVYAQGLPWPTAVICWDGGIFVGASPDILYLKDTNGDGTADVRRVVFTGFGNRTAKLNVQQLLNSFTWGLDNRIHGALGGNPSVVTNLVRRDAKPLELRNRDFSFDPRTFDLRAETGGGQWGMSFDDEGNKFICNNSRHIAVDIYDDRHAARNPFYAMPSADVSIAADGPAAEVFRLSPDEPWRVIRTKWRVAGLVSGPVEGGGRASGYFTGATGTTIYRGDAFPPEYHGDAFIADCGSNLIHRKKIRRSGLDFVAERPADEQRREFLASRDNWFRPVSFANAPDGTLYFVDMYRETIEHPWSLPPELKSRLDLNSGHDRGRIWRIVPEKFKQPKPLTLANATTAELVQTLAHANGWHRDTAARLLVQRNDSNAVPLLRAMLKQPTSPLAPVHALHLLNSYGALDWRDVQTALRASNAVLRRHAVTLVKNHGTSVQRDVAFQVPATDSDLRVRYQAALECDDSIVLTRIIAQDVEHAWMRAAVLSGLRQGAADVFAALALNRDFTARPGSGEFLRDVARIAGASAPTVQVALCLKLATRSASPLGFASAFAAGLQKRNATLASVDAKVLATLTDQAQRTAGDAKAAEPQRVEAAEFLGTARDAASRQSLVALLNPAAPSPVQTAAITALSQRRELTNVIAHWPQLTRPAREKAVALLLSRREGAGALLQAIEQVIVARNELAAADVQRLTTHSDARIRDTAKKLFQRDTSARADVVKKFQPALQLTGNAERGHALYQQRCASCHRAGTEGFAVGPDLASVATAGKEKLLASIVDPNAEVAASYVAYSIETKGGESFVGVLGGESPLHVLLKMAGGESLRLGRESISATRASDKSLMPEGLEEGLSAQEMADLLEFVATAKPAP